MKSTFVCLFLFWEISDAGNVRRSRTGPMWVFGQGKDNAELWITHWSSWLYSCEYYFRRQKRVLPIWPMFGSMHRRWHSMALPSLCLPLSVESTTERNEDLTEPMGTTFPSLALVVIPFAGAGSRTSVWSNLGQWFLAWELAHDWCMCHAIPFAHCAFLVSVSTGHERWISFASRCFSHGLLPSYQPTFNRSVEKAISSIHIRVTVGYQTLDALVKSHTLNFE